MAKQKAVKEYQQYTLESLPVTFQGATGIEHLTGFIGEFLSNLRGACNKFGEKKELTKTLKGLIVRSLSQGVESVCKGGDDDYLDFSWLKDFNKQHLQESAQKYSTHHQRNIAVKGVLGRKIGLTAIGEGNTTELKSDLKQLVARTFRKQLNTLVAEKGETYIQFLGENTVYSEQYMRVLETYYYNRRTDGDFLSFGHLNRLLNTIPDTFNSTELLFLAEQSQNIEGEKDKFLQLVSAKFRQYIDPVPAQGSSAGFVARTTPKRRHQEAEHHPAAGSQDAVAARPNKMYRVIHKGKSSRTEAGGRGE